VSTTQGSVSVQVSADEVFALVREALATVLERDPTTMTATAALAELGADSLALVEVAEIVEERVAERAGRRLWIPDADLGSFETVGELGDYVVAALQAAAWTE
jgi:acyl carrier protein